jgi:hypothetical protein
MRNDEWSEKYLKFESEESVVDLRGYMMLRVSLGY